MENALYENCFGKSKTFQTESLLTLFQKRSSNETLFSGDVVQNVVIETVLENVRRQKRFEESIVQRTFWKMAISQKEIIQIL